MAAAPRTVPRVLCALVLAALLIVPGPASASSPVFRPPAQVRVGHLAALPPGARLLGARTPSATLDLTIALTPRDPAALAAYARSVATPGSSVYRTYLGPRQFARRFGATRATLDAVRASLHRHGLPFGRVSVSALSISFSASTRAIERAFSLSFIALALPGRRTAITTNASPAFDSSVAHSIQAVLGLSTLSKPRPLLRRIVRTRARASLARPNVVTGGPQPCPAARAAAPSQAAYTTDQIAYAYKLPGLYGAGDTGAGVTVAVYELEPNNPSDIAVYQSCYGTHTSVSYVHVDGGAGSGPGTGEAALDIENVIGVAPAVHLLVYQGSNSASGSSAYDTYRAIVDQDRAQVVTTSWGQCEPAVDRSAAQAENTLFQQAAVQGQTIIAAAGDDGSEDCTGGGAPDTSLQVEDPASQPFVTGVGGTRLVLSPTRSESVWNDGGSLASALTGPGAGGGGVSSFWAMPASQSDAPASLHIVQAGSSGAPCGQIGGFCREVPDVAADADPATGYLIYWNGSGSVAGLPAGWQGIGGTSGAAPTWAGLIALADASPGCSSGPLGFANPALYRAAASSFATVFNDVVSGENDFTGTGGGRYAAGPGYDMASGLGTPNGATLARTLCDTSIRLANPGPQLSTVRTAVSVRVAGSDPGGSGLSSRASGLPPGLSIRGSTGRISGRPRRVGTFRVTVVAEDRERAFGHVAFTWRVGGAPKASAVSLLGSAGNHLQLSFTLAAALGAPPIESVSVKLPGGLRFTSGRRIAVHGVNGARLAYSARISRGTLTITLRRGARRVHIVVPYPQLRATANAVSGNVRRLILKLSVVDTNAGLTPLAVGIGRSP
jgi:Pro-kumamolisin, activation domain/Putative Ig domain